MKTFRRFARDPRADAESVGCHRQICQPEYVKSGAFPLRFHKLRCTPAAEHEREPAKAFSIVALIVTLAANGSPAKRHIFAGKTKIMEKMPANRIEEEKTKAERTRNYVRIAKVTETLAIIDKQCLRKVMHLLIFIYPL